MKARKIAAACLYAATLYVAATLHAQAADLKYENGGFSVNLTGLVTAGVAWRTQNPDIDLLGKLSVPGQQNLCTADDCMSQTGDTAPNQRLVNARGSLSGTNGDNGNMNYKKGDIVAATTKIAPTVNFSYGQFVGKLRGIGYYDPVNTNFDETHNNTRFQPRHTQRTDNVEDRFADGFKLREAYVSTAFKLGDNDVNVTVGNQIITWGESNLTLFNTLNVINPPDAGVARMPGFQINEVYQPIPAITIGGEITKALSIEAMYQLGWVPVQPDPSGSFFSNNDVLGSGRYFILGIGQFSEDPDRKFRPAGLNSLISQSSRTAYVLDQHVGYPRDGGQFGAQLKYFAENFNGGTEFGLYYLNYHSRLPYFSAYAADASCTRDAVTNTFAEAFVVCQGFNGTINPVGREPLPVDTVKPFLDYPEDIHMLGASFNTNVGDWSFTGEYAYRPNMPLQIQLTDVIFAGLSPAFPREDIAVPADFSPLGVNAPFTIPGSRHAVPDYLSVYRHTTIGAGDLIRGYERLKVGQLTLTGIRIFGGSNFFKADQITILVEGGLTHIDGMPKLTQLQFEGQGERTHFSAGADGSGSPTGPDSLRVNPTRQKDGFATPDSWGYRAYAKFTYNDVFAGINMFPMLVWFHDIKGISPATIDNYVEDRKLLVGVLDFEFNQSLAAGMQYQLFTGAGNHNTRSDRDNFSVNLRYSF